MSHLSNQSSVVGDVNLCDEDTKDDNGKVTNQASSCGLGNKPATLANKRPVANAR